VWDAVASLLPARKNLRVIDIGSGLGGLVLDLAGRRPGIEALGVELAPLPWLVSRLRARLAGSRARFIRGDYERLDFAQYDLVFAYLSPAVMKALWCKAAREMRPGSVLLSYEFVIDERLPNRTVYPTQGGPALYIWHF
jgi:SAM-dependent methyltransferase